MSTNYLAQFNANLNTFNAVNINYSTLTGSTINVSTVVNSTITTRQLNFSTLVGSTITASTMTTQSMGYSTLTGSMVTTSSVTASTIGVNTMSVSTMTASGNAIISGNVGIGTATPTYRFDMPAGDMAISGRLLGLTSPGNLFWLGLRGTATESQRLAIGINGDPITGILSGVQMGINGGGLFVNSSNYVGIGTATPSAQLSIHGNTSSWSSTSLLGITNTNATPNASLYLIAPNMTANQPHAITLGKALTQYNSMQWIYTHIANDSTDNYMNFTPYGGTVNGIGCLYLRATGNVGIGVTNPFGFFQIACTSSTSQGTSPDGGDSHGLVFTSPKTGTSVYAMAMGVDFTTGYGYINGAGNTATQPILLNSRGGNVGIGTQSPSASLHINNASGNRLNMLYLSSLQSGIVLDSTASSGGRSYNIWSTNGSDSVGNGCLVFFDMIASAYRMVINSGGYVGIGTTNPTVPLYVAISANISVAGGYYFATNTGTVTFSTGPQDVSILASQYIVSNVGFLASSDMRIKKNIQHVTNSLEKLSKLDIVEYDKIDYKENGADIGIIAQNVETILPKSISKSTKYIPNIYERTSYELIDNGIRIFINSKEIQKNTKIRLYISKISIDKEIEYDTIVIKYTPDSFDIKKWDNYSEDDKVFVYGTEVDDFLSVDKDQIGILAAGGVKELHQIIKEQQIQINQLIQRLAVANIA